MLPAPPVSASLATKINRLQSYKPPFSAAAFDTHTTHSISLKNISSPPASTATEPILGLASMSKEAGAAVADVKA